MWPITLLLNKDETQALVQLIDAAVKAEGLRAARAAAVFQEKIDAAVDAARDKQDET